VHLAVATNARLTNSALVPSVASARWSRSGCLPSFLAMELW